MALDILDVIKRAKPREHTVTVCLAGDDAAEVERLERELASLADAWEPTSLADKHPGEAAAKKIATIRARMQKAQVEFRFRALGATAWSDLLAAHPSENKNEAWNTKTFPIALLAASCIDPAMTPEQATTLCEQLNEGQRLDLHAAAWEVNQGATSVPFSVSASAILSSIAEK